MMRAAKFFSGAHQRVARAMVILSVYAVITAAVVIIAAVPHHSAPVVAPVVPTGTVLSFSTMAGVDDTFLNNTVVRGVKGDELPWEVGTVDGTLTADGHLHLAVTGIVFSNDPTVPPELRGINDEVEFRAVVSCLTNAREDGGKGRGHGLVATQNIVTAGFPATTTGNSTIDTTVTLPSPCVAPVVFVIGGDEEHWFSVTGSYEEEN